MRQDSTESIALHDRQVLNEKSAANVLDTIVAACISTSTKFVDSDFPTTNASLYSASTNTTGKNTISWNRAILTKKSNRNNVGVDEHSHWVVFRSDPSSEDLFQGSLGNCYFISALSCIAQRPHLIKRLFVGYTYDDLYRSYR